MYPVYADYGYFENQELSANDYDIQNGIFFLKENISFKDDLFAKYSYFDNFYEYKGFYSETLRTFLHLDLNPSVGHYSTLPMTTYVNGVQKVEYKKVPSSKLLNKLIHIYIVPDSENGNSIRHCFSREEWRNIQQSNPMYLLLAKVQVREHTSVKDVVVMDARTAVVVSLNRYQLKRSMRECKEDNVIGTLATGMEKHFTEMVS